MTSVYKKVLFQIFKLLSWGCFIIFFIYIMLSVLFFVVGRGEFYSFQSIILSSPVVYIVPVVLVVSLIAGSFRDFDED
jgi:hypothetical protein